MSEYRQKSAQRTPVGLDVGARGVRAAQLVSTRDGWSICAVGACERGSSNGSSDGTKIPIHLLKMVTNPDRFRRGPVVATVSSPDVDYFALELPEAVRSAGEDRTAGVVQAEVCRLMGGEPRSIVSHFWESPPGKPPSPNILGVGASHATLDDLLENLDAARLQCTIVEPAAVGLSRFGTLLLSPRTDQIWGVLDLGARQARLVVCLGNQAVFARTVGVGVDTWVERISEALDVSRRSAEVHLRDHGIPPSGDVPVEDRTTRRGSLSGLIIGAIRRDLRNVVKEVESSVAYMKQCYPQAEEDRVILSGGGALVPNLSGYFELSGSFVARTATSLLREDSCKLTFSSGHAQPLETMAVAIGAALPE